MDVLLCCFDLYGSTGGGQTFYKGLIARNPSIRFTYFQHEESPTLSLPANVRAVSASSADPDLIVRTPTQFGLPPGYLPGLATAEGMARAVAGNRFSIVEVPDFHAFGAYLPAALAAHGVGYERFVVSMHGLLSDSLRMNWMEGGEAFVGLRHEEDLLYRSADLRYFISERYQHEWRVSSSLPSCYIDPLHSFDLPTQRAYVPREGGADLNFIGRLDKRKGPHLFVDLLGWLPRSLFRQARVVGPDHKGPDGFSAQETLVSLARTRGILLECPGNFTRDELAKTYASKSVTFVTSLDDTFNLVALESLFSGCPVVVSNGAGIVGWLDKRFPTIPKIVFDLERPYAVLAELVPLLENYERERRRLEEALAKITPKAIGPSIVDVYREPACFDPIARRESQEVYERFRRCLDPNDAVNQPSVTASRRDILRAA